MITIFNGRRRELGMEKDTIFVQIDVALREYLHLFKNSHNANPLSVFMCLALHVNPDGWAWPTRQTIEAETGLGEDAVAAALSHLRATSINGARVLEHYRAVENGRWGDSYYLLFPNAGVHHPPHNNLQVYNPSAKQEPACLEEKEIPFQGDSERVDPGDEFGDQGGRRPKTSLEKELAQATGRKHIDGFQAKIGKVEGMLKTGQIPRGWIDDRLKFCAKYKWKLSSLLNALLNEGNLADWKRKHTDDTTWESKPEDDQEQLRRLLSKPR